MTDLYSVLRNSIRRGDLHDTTERERLYEHARDIMIRKLWAFRPALSSDEIDEKIRAFDLAIGRIEDEVTYHLGAMQRPALMAPVRQMAQAAVLPAPAEPVRQPRRVEWNERANTARSAERRSEPVRAASRPAPQPAPAPARRREAFYQEQPAPADDYDFDDQPQRTRPQRTNGRYQEPQRQPAYEAFDDDRDEDDVYADRPAYADFPDRPQWHSGRGRFVMLVAVAFGVAAAIWTLTVSYSALFPPEPNQPVVASTSGSAIAAAPNDFPRLERVDSTISVFDGRDPTVFEGTTDNPIRFSGNSEGGFARVTSTSGSTGARAMIGPGLVQRLAGKRVRVVVTARASRENGALTSRFALQSGAKLSPWTSVILSDRFAPVEIIWAVPNDAGAPTARNFMVVQPGVPGDGTGVDIRSIRIDILS